jgi:hypothetical protein
MGNGYLRSLIVVGATAMIRYAREKGAVSARWINALLEKKAARLVSVAVANKTARIAWALLVRKEGRTYDCTRPYCTNAHKTLAKRGRSLIALPLSMFLSPLRITVLSAVGTIRLATVKDLVEDWIEIRSTLQRQLEMLGKCIREHVSDTRTKETIVRIKVWIGELNALLKEYARA